MPESQELDFLSHGTRCGAALFNPEGSGPFPCVVLAAGFGALRETRLDAFAERFADAGIAALTFDYRHFGSSDGLPRHLLSVKRQREDWVAAIDFTRTLPLVNKERIALWGSSFSGGHVIAVAAGRRDLAAVIAQVPFVDGRAIARINGLRQSLRLAAAGIKDVAHALLGRQPYYVPIVADPGSLGAMTSPGAAEGYFNHMRPDVIDRWRWRNEVAARVFLTTASNRPVAVADHVECPLLVVIAERDNVTPPGPAVEVARRAPRGELKSFPTGHFDVYQGEWFERVIEAEIDFLKRTVAAEPDRIRQRSRSSAP